jgi:hypothetical protein
MTPADGAGGNTVWTLQFVHDPPEDVEPGSDLDAVRGGDVSLTLLPSRHGMVDQSWIPGDRSEGAGRPEGAAPNTADRTA